MLSFKRGAERRCKLRPRSLVDGRCHQLKLGLVYLTSRMRTSGPAHIRLDAAQSVRHLGVLFVDLIEGPLSESTIQRPLAIDALNGTNAVLVTMISGRAHELRRRLYSAKYPVEHGFVLVVDIPLPESVVHLLL